MCDTLVALKNATKNEKVIFAKNSDREPDEPAEIIHLPRMKHEKGSLLKTTYIEIPQVRETAEILLCKPIWMWGAEMGTNEYGVTIGNEAVYTKEKYRKKGGLLGMDLLRLALERSKTANDALETIIDLLELFGQGGNCGYRDKLYYHNSFLIADKEQAWVLETADKFWIAEKVHNIRSISNTITIQGEGDIHHPELIENAVNKGWCKKSEEFNFYDHYRKKCKIEQIVAKGMSRVKCSTNLMQQNLGEITEKAMMSFLRHHEPVKEDWNPADDASFNSICIHAKNIFNPSQSTISMVSVLDEHIQTHWITGTSSPCTSIFKPVYLPGGMPKIGSKTTRFYDKDNIWWRHEVLHRLILKDYVHRLNLYKPKRNALEQKFISESEQLLKKIDTNSDLEDEKNDLKSLTMRTFSEAMLQEEQWINTIKDESIQNKPNLFYRFYWRKRNKRNKMPFS